MIKRLGVLAVAIVMGIGIGFAGNAYLEEDATAAGGWNVAKFDSTGGSYTWDSGSQDWYGTSTSSQTIDEFLATIPNGCTVDIEVVGSSILIAFPSSCPRT